MFNHQVPGAPNTLLFKPDSEWNVSFNPDTSLLFGPLSGRGAETALITPEGDFLIVDVDAREDYVGCTTYEEARAVFDRLAEEHGRGMWSTNV